MNAPRFLRTRALLMAGCALAVSAAVLTDAAVASAPKPAPAPVDRTLHVVSNNIENLVRNNSNGSCTRISASDHWTSILGGVKPDILIYQQVRGQSQADAYADQLTNKFGDTYVALVAWADPEEWGSTHSCSDTKKRCESGTLGSLKCKQTNAIIYNADRLDRIKTSDYWSAGWLPTGQSQSVNNCRLYKEDGTGPGVGDGPGDDYAKWKRTSALAARFQIEDTNTYVFVATMHLPQENKESSGYPCAGDRTFGELKAGCTDATNPSCGTGIHFSDQAAGLRDQSNILITGIDANRTGEESALARYGMTSYGTGSTDGSRKIDYLFVKGSVTSSGTRTATLSNHMALYANIAF